MVALCLPRSPPLGGATPFVAAAGPQFRPPSDAVCRGGGACRGAEGSGCGAKPCHCCCSCRCAAHPPPPTHTHTVSPHTPSQCSSTRSTLRQCRRPAQSTGACCSCWWPCRGRSLRARVCAHGGRACRAGVCESSSSSPCSSGSSSSPGSSGSGSSSGSSSSGSSNSNRRRSPPWPRTRARGLTRHQSLLPLAGLGVQVAIQLVAGDGFGVDGTEDL